MAKRGYLKHNSQGRYQIESGPYFTSGDQIALKLDGVWVKGRIEYSWERQDYYFVGKDGIETHGLTGIEAKEI